MSNNNFALSLSIPQINQIMAGLAELPYKDVASLIQGIQSQIQQQQVARSEAANKAVEAASQEEVSDKAAEIKPLKKASKKEAEVVDA